MRFIPSFPKPARLFIRILIAAALASTLPAAQDALASIEGTPAYFTIHPNGGLTCEGTSEDACAFYDELATPDGPGYVVQGSFSRKRHASDKAAAAEYINFYFALLCRREGDRLIPTFSFLEGRERVSDLHFYDLDGDGMLEVVVTAIFGPHGAYASVYRLPGDGAAPERIFSHRVDSAQADFEVKDGVPVLTFERRGPADDGPGQEEYAWNGTGFVPRP